MEGRGRSGFNLQNTLGTPLNWTPASILIVSLQVYPSYMWITNYSPILNPRTAVTTAFATSPSVHSTTRDTAFSMWIILYVSMVLIHSVLSTVWELCGVHVIVIVYIDCFLILLLSAFA